MHSRWLSQSCPTLCDPVDCSPSNSSVHGDSKEILEWIDMTSFRGSSQLRDQTQVSHIAHPECTKSESPEIHLEKFLTISWDQSYTQQSWSTTYMCVILFFISWLITGDNKVCFFHCAALLKRLKLSTERWVSRCWYQSPAWDCDQRWSRNLASKAANCKN